MNRCCLIPKIAFVTLVACGEHALQHDAEAATEERLHILYVDDDAPFGGDGAAWTSAYCHLQDALTRARQRGDVSEIRVAQGTYKPDRGIGIAVGDQTASFDLVIGVAHIGGYAGMSATDPDECDPDRFVTTLSGDLTGNDGPDFTNYTDNSIFVVRAFQPDLATTLSGFTITAAKGDFSDAEVGGGVRAEGELWRSTVACSLRTAGMSGLALGR